MAKEASEQGSQDHKLHPNWGTVFAIGFALLSQTGAAVWWASTTTQQLTDMREWQTRQDERLNKVESMSQSQRAVAAAVNATMDGVRRDLDRIEKAISVNSDLLRKIGSP